MTYVVAACVIRDGKADLVQQLNRVVDGFPKAVKLAEWYVSSSWLEVQEAMVLDTRGRLKARLTDLACQ